jgi:deoxyribonuclease-4
MAEFNRAVGVDRIRVWHLNDSRRERGSRVDRHAGIGQGHLGLEPFRFVVNDPRFRDVPLILETPKGIDDQGEEFDAVNLRVLRQLETRSSGTA